MTLEDDEDESFSVTPETVIERIIEEVGEDLFADEENTFIEYHFGRLLVRQSKKTQDKIGEFLKKWQTKKPKSIGLTIVLLRKSALNLPERSSSKSWTLSSQQTKNLFKLLQRKKNALLSLQRMTLRSGQKVFLYRGMEQKYLSSYEMVTAGTAQVVQKLPAPKMGTLLEGFLVSPLCTFGRGAFRLDLTCVNSHLKTMNFFQTKYGQMELPQLSWQKLQSNLVIPRRSSAIFEGDGERVVWVIPRLED